MACCTSVEGDLLRLLFVGDVTVMFTTGHLLLLMFARLRGELMLAFFSSGDLLRLTFVTLRGDLPRVVFTDALRLLFVFCRGDTNTSRVI